MVGEEVSSSSSWSREQDKAFENALGMYPEDCSHRWEKITEAVAGKTMEEVRCHYELLVDDVGNIEAGRVPLPDYVAESLDDDVGGSRKGGHSHSDSHHGGKGSRSDHERRKGFAWTEEEHRLFLLGLEKYGKGDWRSISRNFVISRTPTQVASHAQKYFNRLNSMYKDKRRSSIHDITSVGNEDISAAPREPITGQTNGPARTPGKLARQSPQPPAGPPGVGVYGTTIGQPVGVPLVSAMGTPVNLPIPAVPHMAHGMRLPFAGTVVPGAPVNLTPMTYPMPHTPTHR